MRAVFAAAVLVLSLAAPAGAQSAAARMTASASVVAPVSVSGAAVAAAPSAGGIDVTRPLAVAGSGAWVLEVVQGASADPAARRLIVPPRPHREAAEGVAASPVTIRLPLRRASGEPLPINYVVAMIN